MFLRTNLHAFYHGVFACQKEEKPGRLEEDASRKQPSPQRPENWAVGKFEQMLDSLKRMDSEKAWA